MHLIFRKTFPVLWECENLDPINIVRKSFERSTAVVGPNRRDFVGVKKLKLLSLIDEWKWYPEIFFVDFNGWEEEKTCKKDWEGYEWVMRRLWMGYEKVMNGLWGGYEWVMRRLWMGYEKVWMGYETVMKVITKEVQYVSMAIREWLTQTFLLRTYQWQIYISGL